MEGRQEEGISHRRNRYQELLLLCCHTFNTIKEVKAKYRISDRRFRLRRRSRGTFLNNRGFVSVRKIQALIRDSTEDQLHEKIRDLLFSYWDSMKIFASMGVMTAKDYMEYRLCLIDQPWLELDGAFESPEMMDRFHLTQEILLEDPENDEIGSAQELLEADQRAFAEIRRRQAAEPARQDRGAREQPSPDVELPQEDQEEPAAGETANPF